MGKERRKQGGGREEDGFVISWLARKSKSETEMGGEANVLQESWGWFWLLV